MEGAIVRGGFVRLAYRLGREAATGGLVLDEDGGARHELYLRRGYLTCAQVAGLDAPLGRILVAAGAVDEAAVARSLAGARGLTGRALGVPEPVLDAALRRQADLRLGHLAALAAATWRFDGAAPAPPAGRGGRPFSLTAWARRHVEAGLDPARARAGLAGARLVLTKALAPETSECDEIDRRILAALATPRQLHEVARVAAVPELRLCGFLGFLAAVGALATRGADDARALRQAYHEAARRLHPDMHPDAAAAERRALASEFARLTSAYRALSRIC
jgi:hypothetical protein